MRPSTSIKRIFIRGIWELLINQALKSSKLVIVTTPRLKEIVIARGVRPENVIISPNYVDEELFSPNADGKWVRRKLSIPSHEKVIIYMGRLSYEKGVNVLVKAFSIIQNNVYNAKLVIVGDGPEKDKLKEDCQKLKIQEKVIFIKPVPHILVPNFLAASDIVVLPSYSEGHPKFLIEAMIMGKPIVATNVPGINDVVTHFKEAVLVEAGDANALAKAIELLLKDEKFAYNLAYNARKKALEIYSKSSVFKGIEDNPFRILGF
jgi:glycosyltransferase involved in cell wall biosynthesis